MSTTATLPGSATNTPVKTSKVTGRRKLHFTKLAEIQTDAENLGAATCGNSAIGRLAMHYHIWRGR